MKLLNYDSRDLIMQNVRSAKATPIPDSYTDTQYKILCNLIRQKKITKQFFDFIIMELYGLEDWRKLDYEKMYQLIHVLTFWDYKKERS